VPIGPWEDTHTGCIEAVKLHVAIGALVDMIEEGDMTIALRRAGSQRRRWRDDAGTHDAAVAILEIVA
jgi:hypothetical protein